MAPSVNSFGELTAGVLHLGPRLTRLELDGLRLKRFPLAADRVDGSRLERLDSAGMAFLVYLCRLNPTSTATTASTVRPGYARPPLSA